jgi:heme A synthase
MDMIIALAFALWFIYELLKNLLNGMKTPDPTKSFLLALWCLVAALILLYNGGYVHLK